MVLPTHTHTDLHTHTQACVFTLFIMYIRTDRTSLYINYICCFFADVVAVSIGLIVIVVVVSLYIFWELLLSAKLN